MFFFFPYTTDAPLYHLPIATIGLILANILVYMGMFTGQIPDPADWILVYGHGLHPAQSAGGDFWPATSESVPSIRCSSNS